MQCALDAGAVVGTELADPVSDMRQVGPRHVEVAKQDLIVLESRFRGSAEVEDDLDQLPEIFTIAELEDAQGNGLWQDIEQFADIIGHFVFDIGEDGFRI